MRISLLIGLMLIQVPATIGCSENAQNPRPESITITEIRERIPLGRKDTGTLLEEVLEQHGFSLTTGFSERYAFETNTVTVKDSICNATYLKNAPISCQVGLFGKVDLVTEEISNLTLRYEETCGGNLLQPTACPGSKGEKLLHTIHQQIKNKFKF